MKPLFVRFVCLSYLSFAASECMDARGRGVIMGGFPVEAEPTLDNVAAEDKDVPCASECALKCETRLGRFAATNAAAFDDTLTAPANTLPAALSLRGACNPVGFKYCSKFFSITTANPGLFFRISSKSVDVSLERSLNVAAHTVAVLLERYINEISPK
jgi:hypothetical protein